MQTFDLNNKTNPNKDYYEVIIDLENKNFFMVKNASCTASCEKFLSTYFNIDHWDLQGRFRIFFNNELSFPDMDRVPKKYHKYVKG